MLLIIATFLAGCAEVREQRAPTSSVAAGTPVQPPWLTTKTPYQPRQLASTLGARRRVHLLAGLGPAARAALERLLSPTFVDQIERGAHRTTNTGSMDVRSPDGQQMRRLVGDGKTTIDGAVDALMALSTVYEIAPGLRVELGGRDFSRYLPADAALRLAWVNDSEDFYLKGPGIAKRGSISHAMARQLLDDFFAAVETAAESTSGGTRTGPRSIATPRFAHAEIIIAFASMPGLQGVQVPVPRAALYSCDTKPWRGEDVAPHAANIPWDAWRDDTGKTLVRMLYNERETSFKQECDTARRVAGSVFYELRKLRACHAQQ